MSQVLIQLLGKVLQAERSEELLQKTSHAKRRPEKTAYEKSYRPQGEMVRTKIRSISQIFGGAGSANGRAGGGGAAEGYPAKTSKQPGEFS